MPSVTHTRPGSRPAPSRLCTRGFLVGTRLAADVGGAGCSFFWLPHPRMAPERVGFEELRRWSYSMETRLAGLLKEPVGPAKEGLNFSQVVSTLLVGISW